ncbi:MAG TPA: NAD(P)H-quinone oxidoreductase [Povalibacter sp.]
MMRIVDVPKPGGPDALILSQRSVPVCARDEVLIKVAAAGLNRADVLQRRGHYPSPPGAPSNPGLEVAGTVTAIGSEVHDCKVGDRVCALLAGGGYAEYCTVNAGHVLPVPGSLNMIEAASLPEAAFTAWTNLYQFGRLQARESLLVHGGSSGIGTFAIQLASVLGSFVYATAGSDEKMRFCEQLGARRAVNYRTQDFVAVTRMLTGGNGVDVILDMVGGSYLPRNIQLLATQGRLVMIATQGGVTGELDLLRVMQQRLVITGSTLRSRSAEFKQQVRDTLLQQVWPLLANGAIRPVVDRTFTLADATAAHSYMEGGTHKGKIILTVDC